MKCGCGCGAVVIFETKRKYYKKTDRWAEYTYARSSKRCSKCTQKGIDLAELEGQLDETIAPVTIDEETWRLGIQLLNAKYESEAKQRVVQKIGWNLNIVLTCGEGEIRTHG